MTAFQTVAVAFSMFSAIPMPNLDWNEKNMRYALCAFPLVGAVIGLSLWGWDLLCCFLGFPSVLRGIGFCLLPIWITGGIHLDGACDTWDARASHASPEKKQEILKDPHIGSFAAIRLGSWLLLDAALWLALPNVDIVPVLLMFCLSRVMSALAVAYFPLAKTSGLAYTFATAAAKRNARCILLVVFLGLSVLFLLCGWKGIGMLGTALVVFAWYYRVMKREFGGLSGDLAGWFLQNCEMGMLAALCFAEYMEKIL